MVWLNQNPEKFQSMLISSHGCDAVGFMMTSSNGNIFRATGHLCGEFTGPRLIPRQRPVTRSLDVFFDLHMNERLNSCEAGD